MFKELHPRIPREPVTNTEPARGRNKPATGQKESDYSRCTRCGFVINKPSKGRGDGISYAYDSYTKLMLHFNEDDDATTILDDSASNHTITAVGTAHVDTGANKFLTGSLLLDGDSDYITVPNSSDFDFGDDDFTIDFQVKFNSELTVYPASGSIYNLVSFSSVNADENWRFYVENDSGVNNVYFDIMGAGLTWATTLRWYAFSGFNTTDWFHCELSRENNDFDFRINGNGIGRTQQTSSASLGGGTSVLSIGALATPTVPASYVNGRIAEFRVSKGICRHPSNFIPPMTCYRKEPTASSGCPFCGTYQYD